MGKLTKLVLSAAIIMLVILYAVYGYTLNRSIDTKIAKIEDLANTVAKKKDSISQQSLSLESIKSNLAAELATEKDLANQRQIAAEIAALNAAQQQKYLQQLEAQKLADLQKQQDLAAAKTAAAAAAKKAASAKPATKAVATPPKVTRAS